MKLECINNPEIYKWAIDKAIKTFAT